MSSYSFHNIWDITKVEGRGFEFVVTDIPKKRWMHCVNDNMDKKEFI